MSLNNKILLSSWFVLLLSVLCPKPVIAEEEVWTWNYRWIDNIHGINSGSGEASSYGEAMGKLRGECGQACSKLKVEYGGVFYGKRSYTLKLETQDTSAQFTSWVTTQPDPEGERRRLAEYENSGDCPGPTNIRFDGDWQGSLIHQIRGKVFTAFLGSECVANKIGLSTVKRDREIYCSSEGYTPIVGEEGICRGLVGGGITGGGTACDCTENLVEGECVLATLNTTPRFKILRKVTIYKLARLITKV